MKTISFANNKYKVAAGVFIFSVTLLSILGAFLLSLGLFTITIFHYIFDLSILIGPFMVITAILVVTMFIARKVNVKVVLFNAAAFFFVLGTVDAAKIVWPSFDLRNSIMAFFKKEKGKKEILTATMFRNDIKVFYEDEKNYFTRSDIRGYAPTKNRRTRTYSTYKTDTLFDVHYTTDADGLRISPPVAKSTDAASILFFGCSFAFGYGLNDDESVSYITGMKTNNNFKTYNFSFNGYGTHQMVSMLEHNTVDSIVKEEPRHIIYIAISDHINRVANRKDWGPHDPKYELNEAGEAVYAGHFDDNVYTFLDDVKKKLKFNYDKLEDKSHVLQMLSANKASDSYAEEDKELFVALIVKARNIARQKFPNAEFHVVYWPLHMDTEKNVLDKLQQNNIDVHVIGDIIPDIDNNRKYWIKYPYEPHPNVVANDLIATYIVEKIINAPVNF